MYVENRIQEIRKLNNISQIDMAKSLSVSRQTISAIENSKYNPSLELALKISKYFNMPVESIFKLKENKYE